MIAPQQISPPENPEDFEKLCKKIWGEVWECSDTIKLNGKSGDAQCGVDIYACVNGKYKGVQCKKKDGTIGKQLEKKEIDAEIEKAKSFLPKLSNFVIATTAPKSAEIEQYVRIKNEENLSDGLFEITIFAWGDIVDFIREYKKVYDWYVRNIFCSNGYKAGLYFADGSSETIIHPKFAKPPICKYYIRQRLSLFTPGLFDLNLKDKPIPDYDSRVEINFSLKNIGEVSIEKYRVKLYFDLDDIEDIADDYSPFLYGWDHKIVADNPYPQEVFAYGDSGEVVFEPQRDYLVQGDRCGFSFMLSPQKGIDKIDIKWEIFANEYKDEGHLFLQVVPDWYDTYVVKIVDSSDDVPPNGIITDSLDEFRDVRMW